MKITHDKYYTPIAVANYCWDLTLDVIGLNNITYVIEPAIGGGAFLHHAVGHIDLAYDILPECGSTKNTRVIETDFLSIKDKHVAGALVIGNPPFGRCGTMARKFYKKATRIADYIGFILPISQLNNSRSLYEFDLVRSVDLGVREYSGHMLNCCFNIYKRPASGMANHRPLVGSEYLEIVRQDSPRFASAMYDFKMCYWGVHAGRILNKHETCAAVYKVLIKVPELKDSIMHVMETYNWNEALRSISCKSLPKALIYEVVSNSIKKEVAA